MTDEQVAECWSFREKLGALILEAVELVAESHPEALRKALARAFECSAIEDSQGRLMNVLIATQECANEQRLRLDERNRQIEAQERRTDGIEVRLDKAGKAFDALARLFDQLKRAGYIGPVNKRQPVTTQKGGGR